MKTRLALLVAVLIGSGMWAGPRVMGRGHTRSNQNQPDAATKQRQREALEKGGLRAAAAINGHYRGTVIAHHGLNADTLEFLVRHTKVVIVGQIVSNRCWLTSKGDKITTDYEVVVELPLKGQFRPADRLTMSVLGGKVAFEDGSEAEVDAIGMVPPFNGESYILFLEPTRFGPSSAQRAAAKGPIYAPSFQTLSLFRIDAKGLVHPKAIVGHAIAKIYAGKSHQLLIDDVLDLVEKDKK